MACAVRAMIGTAAVPGSPLSARAAAQPSITGRFMSSRTTSGRPARAFATPSSPSWASTTSKPRRRSRRERKSQISSWSSTSSTFATSFPPAAAPPGARRPWPTGAAGGPRREGQGEEEMMADADETSREGGGEGPRGAAAGRAEGRRQEVARGAERGLPEDGGGEEPRGAAAGRAEGGGREEPRGEVGGGPEGRRDPPAQPAGRGGRDPGLNGGARRP